MDALQTTQELIRFIEESPTAFHAVAAIRQRLDQAGFVYLSECDPWGVVPGGRYYTVRNGSSLVAFAVGESVRPDDFHFQMTAAHTDNCTYKVKAVPELEGPEEYLRLNVEAYGGIIDGSWLDRPLGLAGRVMVREDGRVVSRLLDIRKDVAIIPSVAIHMNRDVNKGVAFNRQVDLCPLFSAGLLKKGAFLQMVAGELGVAPDDVLGFDLFLVNHQPASVWGWADEFVSAPKLDDLQCAYASLVAFTETDAPATSINVYAAFDNEEVGSNTKQGAMSTFLVDVLTRANAALGGADEQYRRAVAKSFLVSCDNAHAVHPNHPEKTDAENKALLNSGIVIKEAANQKYTTDAFGRAVFMDIVSRAGVPVQVFANRSDSVGGSTLGNLSNIQVSVHALDIGIPQLAMHSSYETAGVADTRYAVEALAAFFGADIQIESADFAVIG
ncbi:M18 family aminopeptidase [Slackia heliotrinireducens]|uniref:M18 family aminopeptidase n=1 Tax=Slackia heliotrinireducens TaxID=84110 RepID=UPI003315AAD4